MAAPRVSDEDSLGPWARAGVKARVSASAAARTGLVSRAGIVTHDGRAFASRRRPTSHPPRPLRPSWTRPNPQAIRDGGDLSLSVTWGALPPSIGMSASCRLYGLSSGSTSPRRSIAADLPGVLSLHYSARPPTFRPPPVSYLRFALTVTESCRVTSVSHSGRGSKSLSLLTSLLRLP